MRKLPIRHKVTRKTKSGKTVTYYRGAGSAGSRKALKNFLNPEPLKKSTIDSFKPSADDIKAVASYKKAISGISGRSVSMKRKSIDAKQQAIRHFEKKYGRRKGFDYFLKTRG